VHSTSFGPTRKEAKMKREIFFSFLEKEKKSKIFLIFLLRFSETFGLNEKAKFLALYFLLFCKLFFLFSKIIGIFFLLFVPYQKD